jgi:hypothetical protein
MEDSHNNELKSSDMCVQAREVWWRDMAISLDFNYQR